MSLSNEDRLRFENLLRVAQGGNLALIERLNTANEFVALIASHDPATGNVEVFGQIIGVSDGATAVVVNDPTLNTAPTQATPTQAAPPQATPVAPAAPVVVQIPTPPPATPAPVMPSVHAT